MASSKYNIFQCLNYDITNPLEEAAFGLLLLLNLVVLAITVKNIHRCKQWH